MAMNTDAAPKHGGSGGGELDIRLAAVEHRLGSIEKTMVTAEVFEREIGALRGEVGNLRGDMRVEIGNLRGEIGAVRGEIRVGLARVPFETVKGLLAVSGVAAAIATAVYNLWFR